LFIGREFGAKVLSLFGQNKEKYASEILQ
jgi:hypothetical protein